jgi:hypothetical protein
MIVNAQGQLQPLTPEQIQSVRMQQAIMQQQQQQQQPQQTLIQQPQQIPQKTIQLGGQTLSQTLVSASPTTATDIAQGKSHGQADHVKK